MLLLNAHPLASENFSGLSSRVRAREDVNDDAVFIGKELNEELGQRPWKTRRMTLPIQGLAYPLFPAESHSPHSIPPTPLLCFSIHVTSSPFSDHVCSHALFHAMRHLPMTWTVAPIMSGDFIRRIRWKLNVQIKSLPKPISPKRRRR